MLFTRHLWTHSWIWADLVAFVVKIKQIHTCVCKSLWKNHWTPSFVFQSLHIMLCISADVCTFQSNLCHWKQSHSDTMNWSRHKGHTPSSNTGPTTDAHGSTSGSWSISNLVSKHTFSLNESYILKKWISTSRWQLIYRCMGILRCV